MEIDVKALTLSNDEFHRWYYGFNYYPNGPTADNEQIEFLTEALKKVDKSTYRFINFTENGFIRYLTNYNYGTDNIPFEGISYIKMEEVLNGNK